MEDISQIQLIAQLINNMELAVKAMEKSYNSNDGERFARAKKEVLDIQDKISKLSV